MEPEQTELLVQAKEIDLPAFPSLQSIPALWL